MILGVVRKAGEGDGIIQGKKNRRKLLPIRAVFNSLGISQPFYLPKRLFLVRQRVEKYSELMAVL
jgi:hypothetical protein